MFARHVHLHLKPERADEAVAIMETQVLPLLKRQPGFRGACLLTDPTSGEGVFLVLWARAEDSRHLEDNGFYAEQIAKFAEVFRRPPEPRLLSMPLHTFFER